MACACRAEDNSGAIILSYFYVGSRDGTLFIRQALSAASSFIQGAISQAPYCFLRTAAIDGPILFSISQYLSKKLNSIFLLKD